MMNLIKLDRAAKYSEERISSSEAILEEFITTDNMLPNKQGVVKAGNLPPQGGIMPAYKKGNILVGNIRPYLKKIWLADKNGGCSADVLVFKAKEGYDPRYLYYALFRDDFFHHMMRGKKGTKMPRGDKQQILDFLIPDYPLPVQKKIASVLSVLDEKIATNNKISSELENAARALHDYWFVQFDFPDKAAKPYKTSGGEMIYNPDVKRDIPSGWGIGTLLDIAEYTNGIPCQKFRPSTSASLKVIKIKEMHDGFSSDSELVGLDIPEKAIVENGDVLFSWSASLEVQIWAKGKGALNQHIFKVTSKTHPKSFYYFQLLNYLHHFKMMAENRKTTMGHITQDHLQQSRIVLPPPELARRLESIISPMFERIIHNQIENQELSRLRDWLLPMLMNGQITVKQ